MEKYGFIYIWRDRKRKMYYVGSHWGTVDDGYICSSNRMRDAHRRRPKDFKRRILLKISTNRIDLLNEEHKWLLKIKQEELGKRYYNLRQHRWGHWSTDNEKYAKVIKKLQSYKPSEETIQKLRDSHKGQIPWNKGKKLTEEHIKKLTLSRIGKTGYFKGKKFTEEHRKKLSLAKIGKNPWNKGKKGFFPTPEARINMAKAQQKRRSLEKW